LFKGLLEHVDIYHNPSGTEVMAQTTDGKQKFVTTLNTVNMKYPEYKEEFRAMVKDLEECEQTCNMSVVNRKRIVSMLNAIDKVCPYAGDFSPMEWYRGNGGGIMIRAKNELNGQTVLGMLFSQEGNCGNLSEAEKDLVY
jgi:hypothetical protein